jgi:hypothetical protein
MAKPKFGDPTANRAGSVGKDRRQPTGAENRRRNNVQATCKKAHREELFKDSKKYRGSE